MVNKLDHFTKLKKLKDFPRNGDSGISLWAIMCSSIFYVSIFFFFNIHISTIISNTKFWFLITNTLILIIAADFGAFSSSTSDEQDFYDDYVKRTHARNDHYVENSYMKITKKINPEIEIEAEKTEHIKDVVIIEKVASKEAEMDIISKCESVKKPIRKKKVTKVEKIPEVENREPKFDRTYSDKGGVMAGDKDREIVLRRSKSERHKPEAEENEFSAMSVEELNKRVEDFIQRFNQEIRLQAAKTRQNSRNYHGNY